MPAPASATYPHDSASDLFEQRYRLGPVLGRGGAAVVRQALDERLRRPVALKIFRSDADNDLARRFEAEARLLAQLHHPGLVDIFDYGHHHQEPYLVLELLPGPSLRELLNGGPLSARATVQIGRALADALAHIHSRGVVHRDVKPANIVMDEEGLPRLTDFGISRVVDSASNTRTGIVMGTAAYLAPEQVRGHGAGPEADVYALALVLIECLTGQREYPGLPVEAAVARLRRSPVVPAGLPRALTQALTLMTCANPADRISAHGCAALLGCPLDPIAPPSDGVAEPSSAGTEAGSIMTGAQPHAADRAPRSGRGRSAMAAHLSAVAVGAALTWGLVASSGTAAVHQPMPSSGSVSRSDVPAPTHATHPSAAPPQSPGAQSGQPRSKAVAPGQQGQAEPDGAEPPIGKSGVTKIKAVHSHGRKR